MQSESIVYGSIQDWPAVDAEQTLLRRASNRQVLDSLAHEPWDFLGRQMFACQQLPERGLYQTQVIHFGASYANIEYEWSLWIEQFEALLRRLYWSSAVVHLTTELNGTHTFRWHSEQGGSAPQEGPLRLRCVWEREA